MVFSFIVVCTFLGISPSKFAVFLKTQGKLKGRVILKFHINHKLLNFLYTNSNTFIMYFLRRCKIYSFLVRTTIRNKLYSSS